MNTSELIELESFWETVKSLEQLSSKISIEDFKDTFKLDVTDQFIYDVIEFMAKFDYIINLDNQYETAFVGPVMDKKQVEIPFGFGQWLAFQACINGTEQKKPIQLLKEQLKTWNTIEPNWSLAKVQDYEEIAAGKEAHHKGYVSQIENCMVKNCLMVASFKDGKKYEIYAHRIVILDGRLSVIAEEVIDRCLISFFVSDLSEIEMRPDHEYSHNYSGIEIDDFIAGMRAIIDSEERLILKVSNPDKVDLSPPYHFLGAPYITSSSEGEYIWAASVEVSDELFSWLCEIQSYVEILDPSSIKEQFNHYLDQQSKKAA